MLEVPDIVKKSVASDDDDYSLSTDPKLPRFVSMPNSSNGSCSPWSLTARPLACMSTQPPLIYEYYLHSRAQLTSLPFDPISESTVMSLEVYIGPKGNLLEMKPEQCHRIFLKSPIFSMEEINAMKELKYAYSTWPSRVIDIIFP